MIIRPTLLYDRQDITTVLYSWWPLMYRRGNSKIFRRKSAVDLGSPIVETISDHWMVQRHKSDDVPHNNVTTTSKQINTLKSVFSWEFRKVAWKKEPVLNIFFMYTWTMVLVLCFIFKTSTFCFLHVSVVKELLLQTHYLLAMVQANQ